MSEREEGDIIDVPYGMRIIRKKNPKKSWLTAYAEKRKKYKEEGKILRGEEDENEDRDDFDEGDGGDAGENEGGDYGDYDENNEDGYGDEADEVDGVTEEVDEESSVAPSRPKFEIQTDWKYENVPIFKTSSAEKLAQDMGLPTHHEKLVQIKIRRQIEDVHIVHAGVQRMKVGKNGKLIPLETEKRTVAVFDDEDYDRPRDTFTSPDAFKPKTSKVNRNPYNDDFTFGDYVKFLSRDGVEKEGIVMTYTMDRVGVSVKSGARDSDMVFVRYDDPTLKKAVRPQRLQKELKADITSDDVYAMTVIPDDIRKTVIDTYINILDYLVTGSKNVRDNKNNAVSPVMPSTAKTVLKKIMLKEKPRKVLSWDEYYANEFYSWVKHKHHEEFKSKVNIEKVTNIAASTVKRESDPMVLLEEITGELPGEQLKYDTTLLEILDSMRGIENITIFQAMVIQELEKEKQRGREDMKGADIATLLSDVIQAYYRIHPPDINAYYRYIFDLELEQIRSTYNPTDEDTTEFEALYLSTIRDMYDDSIKKYEMEKEQYEKDLEEIENLKKQDNPSLLGKKEITVAVSPFHNDNRSQVEKFEQLMFAMHGSSVHSYLSNVMLPHIFLEGPLAKHALFFRAKIANGSFQFSALVGANIAHYLPEFAMNRDLTDEQWVDAGYAIGAILHNDVSTLVDTYVNILNPTSNVVRSSMTYSNVTSIVSGLEQMLVDPITECRGDTRTGFRRVITPDNKFILDQLTKNLMEERIPEGDLSICYDPSSQKFTCHSTRDVMLSIANNNLTNPHTRKPYPEDFVERIRARNELLISQLKQPGDPDPLPVVVNPIPIVETQKKIAAKLIPNIPKTVRERHQRHIAPKKGNFETITTMLLLGPIENVAIFQKSFTFFTEDEDGERIEQEVPIDYDSHNKRANVAVLTFYADVPESIADLASQKKLIPPKMKNVYVVGLDAKNVSKKDRVVYATRIKKMIPPLKRVFYTTGHGEGNMIDVLIDVVVDMEGIKALD